MSGDRTRVDGLKRVLAMAVLPPRSPLSTSGGNWWLWPALALFMLLGLLGLLGLVRFVALGVYSSAAFMVIWIGLAAWLARPHRQAWLNRRASHKPR